MSLPIEEGEGADYELRAPPEAIAAPHAAGFGVVSLTNNHALDAGEAEPEHDPAMDALADALRQATARRQVLFVAAADLSHDWGFVIGR